MAWGYRRIPKRPGKGCRPERTRSSWCKSNRPWPASRCTSLHFVPLPQTWPGLTHQLAVASEDARVMLIGLNDDDIGHLLCPEDRAKGREADSFPCRNLVKAPWVAWPSPWLRNLWVFGLMDLHWFGFRVIKEPVIGAEGEAENPPCCKAVSLGRIHRPGVTGDTGS